MTANVNYRLILVKNWSILVENGLIIPYFLFFIDECSVFGEKWYIWDIKWVQMNLLLMILVKNGQFLVKYRFILLNNCKILVENRFLLRDR